MIISAGSTDKSVVLRIVDSTDGTPEEGVTSATAGLALWYWREGAALTALTESDLASLDAAHSDGGMLHIGAGLYRVDPPDAAFASGADFVLFGGAATDMVVIPLLCQIGAVPADMVAISGSATAADNLEASALGVVTGSAITGTLTATQFTTDLTEATNDHYNGRVVVFTSGDLAGQAKAILDYDGSAKALTTRAFTEAPGNGDAFVIV